MDALSEFLEDLRRQGQARGNLLGLLHLLIGRRITRPDGTLVSAGLTWREVSTILKRLRWDRDTVRELGLDPDTLPPRDRERFWYAVIARAQVDSPRGVAAGEKLADKLRAKGYIISPAPGQ